jgi:predicted dehydrogenase
MPKLKVAVVGAGILGSRHARVFHEHPDAETVAVVDLDATRATSVAGRFGAKALTSLDALWQEGGIDILAVATPDHLHGDAVAQAIGQGCHVLIEKPLATSREDVARICDATAASDRIVAVNFSQRHVAEYAFIKTLVEDGAIGTPAMVTSHKFDTLYVPTRMIGWAEGTSPIFFMSSHDLDLMHWYLGLDPVEVVARERRGILDSRGVRVHDGLNVLIQFGDEVAGNFHSSWVHPDSYPVLADGFLQLIGSDGMMTLDNRTRRLELFNGRGGMTQTFSGPHTAEERDGKIAGAFTRSIAQFIGCIREGREPETSPRRARPIAEAQIAAIEAVRTGQPVRLA